MNKSDLLLIQKIKPYECIYNQNHEQHRQIEYKDLIWNTIAKELNLKVEIAKSKWKNLRDNYRKNIVRKLKSPKTHKPYKYAEQMKFLDKFFIFKENENIPKFEADDEVSTDLSSACEFLDETPTANVRSLDVVNFEDDDIHEFVKTSPKMNDIDDNMHETNTSEIEFFNVNTLNEDNLAAEQINSDNINSSLNEEEGAMYLENNEEDGTDAIEDNDELNSRNYENIEQDKYNKYNFSRKLIAEIQKYECIYNTMVYEYEDCHYKQQVWQQIGEKLGINSNVAKLKWKNIRDAYRKYKQKVLQTNGFVKPYKYAKYLDFLDNCSTEKGTRPFIRNIPQPDIIPNASHSSKVNTINISDAEVSTDLSSDEEIKKPNRRRKKLKSNNIDADVFNPKAITRRLFILLANKINEANLSSQQRNNIEFIVSSIVYKKLEEHNRNN